MSLSEQLKSAIRESGQSMYLIAKETGIADPILSRFMSENPKTRRDLRLETADKLAAYFGLELQPAAKKPAKKKPAK